MAASCCCPAEEPMGNGLSHYYSGLPLLFPGLLCTGVSHLTPGRGLCFVFSCPTGTDDHHSSSKVPTAAVTSSPALSTRRLPRVPPCGEWHLRQNCFWGLRSHSQCISENLYLFGEYFFSRDYSNFVLKCVFKQLPVLMNHSPGEQAHPPFFTPP